MAERRVEVGAVEVLRCMCGVSVCQRCGGTMDAHIREDKTHCPRCGAPFALPMNATDDRTGPATEAASKS